MRALLASVLTAALLALVGCQSGGGVRPEGGPGGGGFYGGDRPPDSVPVDLAAIPDAVPVALPRSRTGNNPYEALGKSWYPMASAKGYLARGVASWYGKKFHGRRTSSGEPYDMFAMTAAHPVLPLPTFVRVTNLDNGRRVVVKVNDRGPFLHGRVIDLSYAAAWKLGITAGGTGRVEVVALDPPMGGAVATAESAQTNPVPQGVATGTVGGSGGQFEVQLGAFNDLLNALQLRRRLRSAGFNLSPVLDDELARRGAPYRVLVGPFPGQNEAAQARMDLERMIGSRGTVRRI